MHTLWAVMWGTLFTVKAAGMDMSNFKAIFDPLFEKIVRRTPVPGRGCASNTFLFSSMCKNLGAQHPLGAEIWSSEKVDLGRYNFTTKSLWFVDQSSPIFLHTMREESWYKMYLSNFEYLSILEVFAVKIWSYPKSRHSLHVLSLLSILGGSPQEFWIGIIKFGALLISVQNFMPISDISCWN